MRGIAVTAENLVLGYGREIAIESSSFVVPRGSLTAVIGPNGGGKSTLLNAIAGLLEPQSGSVEIARREGSPARVSYVLQTTKVNDSLPISIEEVVTMGRYAGKGAYRWLRKADRNAVAKAIARTGVAGIAGRPLNELSGGQRQRAFVAQGLAQEHDVLLLDEPLSGIDLAAAQAIDGVIHEEINEGCAVIMTTHDLSEAQVADHVLLVSGRVIASGPPEEVLTPDNLRRAYGTSLLHVENGRVLLDDAAHSPVAGRHLHRDRTIHTESSRSDQHGN